MLERRGRSDRLRKILTYYDQNKFIFNLPASLQAALLQVWPLERAPKTVQCYSRAVGRGRSWTARCSTTMSKPCATTGAGGKSRASMPWSVALASHPAHACLSLFETM